MNGEEVVRSHKLEQIPFHLRGFAKGSRKVAEYDCREPTLAKNTA